MLDQMNREKVVLDIPALEKICSYSHWIPIFRGLHKPLFSENYPGWDWNDLVPRLLKKGVLVKSQLDSSYVHLRQGLFISSSVESIEFTPTTSGVRVKVNDRS
jgi:hypothetical protein